MEKKIEEIDFFLEEYKKLHIHIDLFLNDFLSNHFDKICDEEDKDVCYFYARSGISRYLEYYSYKNTTLENINKSGYATIMFYEDGKHTLESNVNIFGKLPFSDKIKIMLLIKEEMKWKRKK